MQVRLLRRLRQELCLHAGNTVLLTGTGVYTARDAATRPYEATEGRVGRGNCRSISKGAAIYYVGFTGARCAIGAAGPIRPHGNLPAPAGSEHLIGEERQDGLPRNGAGSHWRGKGTDNWRAKSLRNHR